MQTAKKRKLERMTLGFKEKQQKKKVHTQNNEQNFEEEKDQENMSDEGEEHDLKFEDDFDDEFEDEDVVEKTSNDNDSEKWVSDDEANLQNTHSNTQETTQKQPLTVQEQSQNIKRKQQKKKQENQQKPVPFLGTYKNLEKDEFLDFDNSAYEMFHRATLEWPSLSCDFILPFSTPYNFKNPQFQDNLKYPLDVFLTMGTQSQQKNQNQIYLIKWSNLCKTKYDDDSDAQSDHSQENDEAVFSVQSVNVWETVNRIRSMNYMPIVAFWTEDGFNLLGGDPMTDPKSVKNFKTSSKSFSNTDEGFALEWSPLRQGYLATGSCDSKIYIYRPNNVNLSDIIRDDKPFTYHKGSVEDICWSPVDEHVFASCSVDGTIQFNDIRTNNRQKSELFIKAHDSDVNVISWCRADPNLIASGGDDGMFKVWDKRYPKEAQYESDFHKDPITSIQFAPNSSSMLSVQSADNRLTIWDLAAENDDQVIQEEEQIDVPDQLMFAHQGQTEMKELRYHPIYYDIIASTSGDSLHIFKPNLDGSSSIGSQQSLNDQVPIVKEKDLDEYLSHLDINK